jgi:phosphoenolpyruvate synthase/pyruvate phosphate dikinase
MGIEHEELVFLTMDEIRTALTAGHSIKADIKLLIAARQKAFSVVMRNSIVHWSVLEHNEGNSTPSTSPNLIRGMTANPGRARGPARVILRQPDITTMQKGEVLVTTMTTPSLMFAVERAVAIVTDEGGMLCHAAIISRELNIPCIIATERATRLIHTGQLIDVDANEGFVRVLNKP